MRGQGPKFTHIVEDIPPETNTSKRLPVVFCLDVSPSMRWREGNDVSAIELLNDAVKRFVTELKAHPKAATAAELSFITFSSNVDVFLPFTSLKRLTVPEFSTVEHGGTSLSAAVIKSINELDSMRNRLKNSEIPYYAPFLVIVTDGNPDENEGKDIQTEAISLIKQHCYDGIKISEMVVPFVIGVGNRINKKILNEFSKVFSDGFFHITGTDEERNLAIYKVFDLIINSALVSFSKKPSETIKTIKTEMNELLADLSGI